jgi:hypothetical protein
VERFPTNRHHHLSAEEVGNRTRIDRTSSRIEDDCGRRFPRVSRVCERCVGDLLYCDRRDADFCPVCDAWVSSGCTDPECSYCPGRPVRPSGCDHPERHYSLYE